jgi:hypothetical protein
VSTTALYKNRFSIKELDSTMVAISTSDKPTHPQPQYATCISVDLLKCWKYQDRLYYAKENQHAVLHEKKDATQKR